MFSTIAVKSNTATTKMESHDLIDYNEINLRVLMEHHCYITILSSFISFTIVYLVLYYYVIPLFIHARFPHIREKPLLHWKITDAVVATIHCVIINILCAAVILDFSESFFFEIEQKLHHKTTWKQQLIMSISIGYFIYDTIIFAVVYSIKHTGKVDKIWIFHHALTEFGLIIGVISVYCGAYVLLILFLNECTNPLLQSTLIRNYLINRKTKSSKQWKDILFVDFMMKGMYIVSFVVFRIFIMGPITYQMIFVHESNDYLKIATGGILILAMVLMVPSTVDTAKVYSRYKQIKPIKQN